MKNKNTVGSIPKSDMKNAERGNMDTHKTDIHDLLLSWLGTSTSIKSGGVKLVLREMIQVLYTSQ